MEKLGDQWKIVFARLLLESAGQQGYGGCMWSSTAYTRVYEGIKNP
jgi:hypothetical protein